MDGIGDTLRISVTGDPTEEIPIAIAILENLGLKKPSSYEIISCPTCARTSIDIINLIKNIESEIHKIQAKNILFYPFRLAVMGCAVNGPGEAKSADIGISGANGKYVIFKYGIIQRVCSEKNILSQILTEIKNFIKK